MYSIVLATMLTAGSATPAWGGHGCFGCWSCSGCYGCSGYGYATGYGCGGGYCRGCCGGCYGCCGGCCGGYGWGSCSGCCGGYGYGAGYYTCCGGCYGYTAPAAAPRKAPGKAPEAVPAPKEAKVVVETPEDVTLYIDGQKSNMTSSRRTFVTPKLATGEKYFYDLKAEVVRDGKVQTETRRVIVTAGEIARVNFNDLGPAVAQAEGRAPATAHLTVRLPEQARLFVDGRASALTSNVRKFETPRLVPGKAYYYTLRAEIERDGQTLVQSQKVAVQAGKKIAVTFDDFAPDATRTASR